MRIQLQDIRSDSDGFERLIGLNRQMNQAIVSGCEIDMTNIHWFQANMCATFGALLYQNGLSGKSIQIIKPNDYGVRNVFNKNRFNRFLREFGYDEGAVEDVHGTTITYQRFEGESTIEFRDYVRRHFIGKGLPDMSPLLLSKFRESIAEVFDNSVVHSHTQHGIFVCGQYFPKKHCLDFSIVDLGIGIRQNIFERFKLNVSSVEAIEWALTGTNTTKHGMKPGGHGLKLLQEFIHLNKGRIIIVSDTGYWELNPSGNVKKIFQTGFPGTVVTIEINTSDTQSYRLSSELAGITDPSDLL